MEDETYGGNYDENRNFVLTNLTNYKVITMEKRKEHAEREILTEFTRVAIYAHEHNMN